jgi:hypothetical protein
MIKAVLESLDSIKDRLPEIDVESIQHQKRRPFLIIPNIYIMGFMAFYLIPFPFFLLP